MTPPDGEREAHSAVGPPSGPTPAVASEATARRLSFLGRLGRPISSRIGVRRSTVVMLVAFLALGGWYLAIKPSAPAGSAGTGASPVAPVVPVATTVPPGTTVPRVPTSSTTPSSTTTRPPSATTTTVPRTTTTVRPGTTTTITSTTTTSTTAPDSATTTTTSASAG